MGLRGPTRNPNSVRGKAELGGIPVQSAPPERITPPPFLSKREAAIFVDMEADAAAAGVPLKVGDRWLLASLAQAIDERNRGLDVPLAQILSGLTAIGLTPQARTRLGISDRKPAKSKTAALLEMAKRV